MTAVNGKGATILQTAVVMVNREGDTSEQVKCRVLLDSGSQRSYITQRVAKELKLPVEEENKLTIFTFGSHDPQVIESPMVKLQICTRTQESIILYANCVKTISQGVPFQELSQEYSCGKFLLADDGSLNDQIDILIGNDYYFSIISMEKRKVGNNLYLIQSAFGWILSGQTISQPEEELSVITYFQTNADIGLSQPDLPIDNGDVKRLWELETIGITDSPNICRDEEAIRQFNKSTKFINNRYTVSWPWEEYPPVLPTNLGLAYGRLTNLIKRLDTQSLKSYDQTIKEQLEKEIIETVPYPEEVVDHPVHYLPHHGVQQSGKALRIVYDASAKTKDNKSLNECLHRGPILLEDLTGLLIRFRSHHIGITADVEKAFLQISLQTKDRDVTRFLWLKDTTKAVTKDNILHLRFKRVPFGIISSPFLLNATIKHHLQNSDEESIKHIAQDIYVDNLVTGTRTTQEAVNVYRKSKETFQQISMNLREWSSNSKEFMQIIPDTCKENIVKTLGLDWNLETDTIQLRVKNNSHQNTKRGILKEVASIYDPCGFSVPSLVPAKLLIQEMWKQKINWDTPLPKELMDRWMDIRSGLEDIKNILLQRCYADEGISKDCQIHCFADSSTRVYAAVVYIVDGKDTSFVIGKSRLVPVKDQENLKIPRLELLAVLIGSRLIKYVLEVLHLNIEQQYLWTDSQIVIDWINSSKLLSPFVARRIKEIKQNNNLIFKYIPSDLNPADIATRPNATREDKERWLAGPEFLAKGVDKWPCGTTAASVCSLVSGEGLSNECNNQNRTLQNVQPDIYIQEVEDQEMTPATNEQKVYKSSVINNTSHEIRRIQTENFPLEVVGKETNLSRNLGLFKDVDGILRCKGRLKNTDWSFDKKYPIIIPRDCDFTKNLIMKTHNDNYHVGINHTLSIIRQTYWIPQGKSQVQKLLRKCPRCVKHGGGPFKLPPTPALPFERVNYSPPFTFVGLDYMGPLLVNNGSSIDKRWIALYTCLAVRAIHLEVVQDLTAEEGLLALRRMISTRGVPTLITSDNAQQFKLLAEILSNQYCVEKKIRWKFIPQLAPWFGGYYERLIGIVKNCMKKTLQKHLLKDSQLVTVMKEIEAVINTRPLTCVDSELGHILSPSDFLTVGRCITMEATGEDCLVAGTTTKTNLIEGWKRALIILKEFKEMFSNQYLPSLRERYWNSLKQPTVTAKIAPKEGQLVQIKGDTKNREGWKVGTITLLHKGSDGLCRVAKVRVGDREFTRSIAHLYPLEIEEGEEDIYCKATKTSNDKEINDTPILELELPTRNLNADDEKVIETEIQNESHDIAIEDDINPMNKEGKGSREELYETLDINETNTQIETNRQDTDTKQRRGAATRALQKIREWTCNLMALL